MWHLKNKHTNKTIQTQAHRYREYPTAYQREMGVKGGQKGRGSVVWW